MIDRTESPWLINSAPRMGMRGVLLILSVCFALSAVASSQSLVTTFSVPGGVKTMASDRTLNKLIIQSQSQPTDYSVSGATNTPTSLNSSQLGTSLIIDAATAQIYTISSDGKTVYDIDEATNARTALNLGGLRYQQILLDENTNKLYVSGMASDPTHVNPFLFAIWVVDGSTNAVTKTITFPVSYTVIPFDPQGGGNAKMYTLGGNLSGQATQLVLNKTTKALYGVYFTTGGQPVTLANAPSWMTAVSDGGAFLVGIDTIASTVSISRLSDNFYLSTLAKDYPCYGTCSTTSFLPVSTGVDDSPLNRVYVLSDHGTVDVLDAATGTVKTERLMGASQHTGFTNMVVDPASHYVFDSDNEVGNSTQPGSYIYVLDGSGLSDAYPLLLTSPANCSPGKLLLDTAVDQVFVAGCQGGIPVIKASTLGLQVIPTLGWTPSTFELNSASRILYAADAANNVLVVGLNSGVVSPALTVNPKTLNFPFPANGQSSSGTFFIQNTGTAPLLITGFEYPTDVNFTQSNGCQDPLPAGTSCPVTMTWTPANPMAAMTRSFKVDVAAPAVSASVTLQTASGIGFLGLNWSDGSTASGPPVTIGVPVLGFNSGTWSTQPTLFQLIIKNQGTAPMTISQIQNTLTSSLVTGLINQSDNCAGAIAPQTSCTVTLTTELGMPYLITDPIPGSVTVNAVENGAPQSLTASYLIQFQL